jgi:hypothetical protein
MNTDFVMRMSAEQFLVLTRFHARAPCSAAWMPLSMLTDIHAGEHGTE